MPAPKLRYTWLLFDADNTLWDFNAAQAAALERTLTQQGIVWSEDVLREYSLINHRVWSDYEAGTLPKSQIRTIRFRQLLELYQLDHPAEQLAIDYGRYLSESTHILPGAIELLRYCRQYYRMGLITNGLKEIQRPRLKNTGLGEYFDFVLISDEVGVAKPDAAFFGLAYLNMEEVPKNEVLVIGDNPNADIAGGRNFGFDTCWLRHPGAAARPKLGATHTIRDIRELNQALQPV